MRRTLAVIVTVLMAFGLASASTLAANAHFIKADAEDLQGDGSLPVSFKIAGLGDNEEVQVTVTAEAEAVYACMNNGGNFPSDPKKQEESGLVSATGTFTSGQNGQVTDGLTVQPPASTLECPGGQTAVLTSVSYTGLTATVTDVATGEVVATESIPGTFADAYYEV